MSASFGPPPGIILAVKSGDIDAVRRSLVQKNDVDGAKNTSYLDRRALHYAAEAGNLDMAKLLIHEFRATVDVADRNGDSPLHLAVQRRRQEMVSFLVDDCRADVQRPGKGGNTALHYASKAGEEDIILFLLQRGASAKQQNDNGGTPRDAAFRRKGMMDLTKRIQEILKQAMEEEIEAGE